MCVKLLHSSSFLLCNIFLDLIQLLTCRLHAVFFRQNPAGPGSALHFFLRFREQDAADRPLVGIQIGGFPHLHTVSKPAFIDRNASHDHGNLTG